MPSRSFRLAAALALTLVGLRWIVNTNPWSGPTVLHLAEGHGVHLNDWVTLVCWAAAAMLVWPRLAAVRLAQPVTSRSVDHSRSPR
ncbi:MAG: hypothetical protein ACK5CE_23505 [Actinomycetes bacterium]